MRRYLGLLVAGVVGVSGAAQAQQPTELLNVSYDIARELYVDLNKVYAEQRVKQGLPPIEVKQSHGGTSKQARSIMEGLKADLVTFNQVTDITALADKGFVRKDWQQALPHNASPYYSLPALLVRKGNPKNIKDWDDLVRPDVQSVFPNPKTSGNARYTYLAAYAYALDKSKGDHAAAKEFVRKLLANVPVFDTGGRGSTTTFAERGIGDVLITFEAEVNGIRKEYGEDKYEIVVPSASILAEFPVAVVDKVAEQRGSAAEARKYLEFLYSPVAQEVLAQRFNRVRDPKIAEKYKHQFPQLRLFTIEMFGGWDNAQKVHFASGGILDEVFERR